MATNDDQAGATIVYLGNRNAISKDDQGEIAARHPGKRCTTATIPAGYPLIDAFKDLTHPTGGVWAAHSSAEAPAWVAAQGPLAQPLTMLLAAQWPGIELRDPEPEGK
jgi:hypothetical protein